MIKSASFGGHISKGSSIEIEGEVLSHPTSIFAGRISIGAYTYFGRNCLISSSKIGRFCSLAHNVSIGLGEHPTSTLSTHPFFFSQANGFKTAPSHVGVPRDMRLPQYRHPVVGNDVWIGSNVVIRRGISIGDGAIVAAGAVVTKDVPQYAIVAGVPAKIIRYRFSEEEIKLLKIAKWWELPIKYFERKNTNDVKEISNKIIDDRINGIVKNAIYKKIKI